MSVITSVVLCTGVRDLHSPCWPRVQAWLAERDRGELAMVDGQFAGDKYPQMLVGGAGYNYFECDEFTAFVLGLPWEDPGSVVLIMDTEDYDAKVYRPAFVPGASM